MTGDNYMTDDMLLNARKPEGKLGNDLIDDMNLNHEGLVRWSLNYLNISDDDVILDIGCGGGVNVERFLEMTDANVYGVDYSDLSVERSCELNKTAIDNGRCEIIHASVSDLPFDDNTFDVITAFETVYFWPDFVEDLKEVRRVLRDKGTFFIANEAQPNDHDERQKHIIDLLDMSIYSKEDLQRCLQEAGFWTVEIFTRQSKDSFTGEDADWICVKVKK